MNHESRMQLHRRIAPRFVARPLGRNGSLNVHKAPTMYSFPLFASLACPRRRTAGPPCCLICYDAAITGVIPAVGDVAIHNDGIIVRTRAEVFLLVSFLVRWVAINHASFLRTSMHAVTRRLMTGPEPRLVVLR